MTPMIDAQGLQGLFQQPSLYLGNLGVDAWKTQQAGQQADLAAVLQKTQQDAEMHPIKMMTEQNLGNQYGAQANSLNASAAKTQDELKVLQGVPIDARIKNVLSDYLKNKSDADKAQIAAQMGQAAQWASIAKQRPLTLSELSTLQQSNPALAATLSKPGGANEVLGWVNTHNALDPTRQREESVANIHNAGSLAVAKKQGKNQLDLENQQAKHGKYFKLANSGFQIRLQNEGNPEKRYQLIMGAIAQANTMPDGPDKEAALAQLEIHRAYAEEGYRNYLATHNPGAGKVDAPAVVNMPSVPQPTVKPGLGPRPSNLPPQAASAPSIKTPKGDVLPQAAKNQLSEGYLTTFSNNQVWTLENGQPKRIK